MNSTVDEINMASLLMMAALFSKLVFLHRGKNFRVGFFFSEVGAKKKTSALETGKKKSQMLEAAGGKLEKL